MPSPVDKYYKQIKKDSPSYSDEQAWATAWAIFCKHKDPGSSHCHKPTEEYLKKAKLVTDFANALLVQKVASRFSTRYLQSGVIPKFEVRVQVGHMSTAETIATTLTKINKLGRTGHSFGIQSDSDDGSLGGWDGDGVDYVIGIKIADLGTGGEKEVSLD